MPSIPLSNLWTWPYCVHLCSQLQWSLPSRGYLNGVFFMAFECYSKCHKGTIQCGDEFLSPDVLRWLGDWWWGLRWVSPCCCCHTASVYTMFVLQVDLGNRDMTCSVSQININNSLLGRNIFVWRVLHMTNKYYFTHINYGHVLYGGNRPENTFHKYSLPDETD